MGLPNYINLLVDYEYPLRRELSVHGGLRKRYAGWSMEGGAKYSLVKSVRTKSLVTVLGDIRINTIPFFVGLRSRAANMLREPRWRWVRGRPAIFASKRHRRRASLRTANQKRSGTH